MNVAAVVTGSMKTRDGIRLDADIYRPDGAGSWPVLLLRQAYGRRVAATVCYAHPRWYAAQGYVVVVQDVRGRGTSEGRFDALTQEAEDGADTIDWCASLPGTTGDVGIYGFSYQGSNQLLAAATAGPALKAMAPAMVGWDPYRDMIRTGGVPWLAAMLSWSAQVGADSARHRGDGEVYDRLRALAASPPLGDAITARPAAMQDLDAHHFYGRWMEAGSDDALWSAIGPASQLEALAARALPMLFIGGWYDFFLPGTLAAWQALAARHADRTHLVVGPWAHLPWGRKVGEIDFGPHAVSDIDRLQVAWFDRWLKPDGAVATPAVRLFDLGTHAWREAATWPSVEQRLHLGGDGRASVDPEAGVLTVAVGEPASDTVVHDPWRPAPTHGGRLGNPPGPLDRTSVDQRGDVLTFTSDVLVDPLTITGPQRTTLHVEADTPSFDLVCTLSRITADERTFVFAEGALTVVSTDGVTRADVDLLCTCITLQPGERIRLSVAAAGFPGYAVNPGNGDPMNTPQVEALVTTVTVHHGADRPSVLVLGVDPAGDAPS